MNIDRAYYAKMFEYKHLPGGLQHVSKQFFDVAMELIALANAGGACPRQTTIALNHLWDSKNRAVVASGFLRNV